MYKGPLELIKSVNKTRYYRMQAGIIYMDSPEELQKIPVTVEDVKTINLVLEELYLEENRPLKLLIDLSQVGQIAKETREYMRSKEAKKYSPYIQATALITHNQLSKMLGNFVLGTLQREEHTKLFTNGEKAVEWLKQL